MSLLDSRLKTVLSLIPKDSILLDVGTDHCKLPAEGLLCGRLAGAYAADVNQGPLQAARKQLTALGLADRIPLYLSDGLKSIPAETMERVTAVAVAGMGGELIESILRGTPKEPPLWILQPMSAVYELLDFMAQNGYALLNAALARDGEKFYRVLAVQKTGIPYPVDYFEAFRKDPLYLPYLKKEEARLTAALRGLESARVPDEQRCTETRRLLDCIRKAKT